MQDLLRDRLKKHGYRVLLFGDPQRAIARVLDSPKRLCDCAIFCTSELGESALAAFNEFGTHESTKDVPAILFADNKQASIIKDAQLADHRVLLSMPLRVRELRDTLLKLLRPQPVGQVSNLA
jgi:CheY-like chemotaxis protein